MLQVTAVINGDVIIRVFDAPANGWRTLFVERDGQVIRYTDKDEAVRGLQIYERADKEVMFKAEFEAYQAAASTGRPLSVCGLPSLVRFGEADHFVYATFTLAEEFIRRSAHKIIGYKDNDPIYSSGWDELAA